jgi:hypothetical protein
MRLHMDEDERALVAVRLGHDEDVSDSELAAAFEAWFENKPTRTTGRRKLTPRDGDHLAGVVDDREAGGYRAQTDWLGVG